MPFHFPLSPLYCFNTSSDNSVNIWMSPYILSMKMKYTATYMTTQISIINDCFLKSPRFRYRYTGHIAATVDQSAGNVMKQIIIISRILPHLGIRSVVKITIKTTDHASDHITLVALKNPLGINDIPPAKSYAKCDMIAKTKSLKAYFLTSRV